MCHKIRCDEESWKLFGFQGEVNKGEDEVLVVLAAGNISHTTRHQNTMIALKGQDQKSLRGG